MAVEQSDIKKALLNALGDNYGIISEATKKVGIARSTFYEWLKIDPEFKIAVDEIQEEAIDHVEGKLFERINGVEVIKGYYKNGEEIYYSLPPDVQAISLYLKTRGKKRGYVEKTEIEHSGEMGIIWHEERTYETKDIENKSL